MENNRQATGRKASTAIPQNRSSLTERSLLGLFVADLDYSIFALSCPSCTSCTSNTKKQVMDTLQLPANIIGCNLGSPVRHVTLSNFLLHRNIKVHLSWHR